MIHGAEFKATTRMPFLNHLTFGPTSSITPARPGCAALSDSIADLSAQGNDRHGFLLQPGESPGLVLRRTAS